jgi:hypothetical protein
MNRKGEGRESMILRQPVLIPVNDQFYQLMEPYEVLWEKFGQRYKLIIPEGFKTDIASVPRLCWTLMDILPDGLHRGAAVVHDFLYYWYGRCPEGTVFVEQNNQWVVFSLPWQREDCDRLFARLMREAGTPAWKRRLMYLAVRLFGWKTWLS